MSRPQEPERTWHYWIDAEGQLWHEGSDLEDPGLLNFFMRKMETLPDGRFHVLCQGEDCFITAEDVPYVIQNIQVSPDQIEVIFPGAYREKLDPSTLRVGTGNVLYCRVREGKFRARFNRKSYLELAKQVQFDAKKNTYSLTIGQKTYPIEGVIEGKK